MARPAPEPKRRLRPSQAMAPPDPAPSLEQLRERIASIIGRTEAPLSRAEPSKGETDFARSETEAGPLYVRRIACAPGCRVGRAPLWAADQAEARLLALLALRPELATCSLRGALYLDTETTGLSIGAGSVAFLVGVAYRGEQGFVVEQLMLKGLGQEVPMLERLRVLLEQATMIVTYNGRTFDMPLLRARYVMNRLAPPPPRPHLDLLPIARRVHKTRLASRTLTAIEEHVLGQTRIDDVAGADVVACYHHFLRTGDESALAGVVEHNERDVLSMIALVGLYGEPLGSLEGEDLAGAALAVRQAGELSLAAELADAAVARGGGASALRARARVAKARGDRDQALCDLEALCDPDASPRDVADDTDRLELAKLYEHYVKEPRRALALVQRGVKETEPRRAHRMARLSRKIERGLQRERAE